MILVIVTFVPLACLRAYRHAIPAGAEFFPFWLASVEGPRLESPDRKRVLQVVFNDAGAAHSGNHWTWLIADDWLMGKRVAAEGYTLMRDPIPWRWTDDRTISIEFTAKRYGNATRSPVVVQLP